VEATGIKGFFVVKTGLGVRLVAAEDAESVMVSSISVAKGKPDSGFDEEAADGKRSRFPVGSLGSPGGLMGVRERCWDGRIADFLIGDIFGVGALTPDNHGAFGVFDISIRAAFVGVCDV